jgi:hypothetical protein
VNLVLSFIHPNSPPRTLGPLKQLWIERESLLEHSDGPLLARHVHHQWDVEGTSYYRLDCTARVSIKFSGGGATPSRNFGPFNRFSAVDGLAYTDDKVFAVLYEKPNAWLCYDVGERWPIMVVAEHAVAEKAH